MSKYSFEIAKIELHVHFGGGAVQGIGGYSLDLYRKTSDDRAGTAEGMEFIRRVLVACGADSWEQLRGRTIYVLRDPQTRRVEGIEPLPTEPGERFIFADVFGRPGGAS